MVAKQRIQFNMRLLKTDKLELCKDLPDTIVPLFWIEEVQSQSLMYLSTPKKGPTCLHFRWTYFRNRHLIFFYNMYPKSVYTGTKVDSNRRGWITLAIQLILKKPLLHRLIQLVQTYTIFLEETRAQQ